MHECLKISDTAKAWFLSGTTKLQTAAIMIPDHTWITPPQRNEEAMLWCSQLNDVLLSTNWMCRLRGVWDWDSGQRLPAWRYLSNLWMLAKHSMHFSTFSYVWAWCFLGIISLSLWISKCMPNDCKRSRAVDAITEKKVQLFIQAPVRAMFRLEMHRSWFLGPITDYQKQYLPIPILPVTDHSVKSINSSILSFCVTLAYLINDSSYTTLTLYS